jgi:hypothetical protein
MRTKHEIHVIGAGLAGLTAAAFIARAGLPVVVHESRNRLGGRATTDDRDGFRFDQGPHALYRGGAAERILTELGVRPRGAAPDVRGVLVRDGRLHRAPAGAPSLLATTALGWRGKLQLARVLQGLARMRPADHAAHTVEEWIDATVQDDRARELLAMLVRLTTYSNHPRTMSADVAILMLQAGLGPGVRYLEGGWDQLVGALAAHPGVRIIEGSPLHELPDAAAVVLAVGSPAAATALAGVPVTRLEVGPAAETACLDLGLRGTPPHPVALGLDVPIYASHHSSPGGRAPAGHSVVALAEYLAPDVEPSRERLEAFAETMGIARGSVVAQRYLHRMVACTAIPSAALGGLRGRPDVDVLAQLTGRPGTFVAGDWVGTEGHLADAVLASARAAALAAVHHVERLPVAG